MIAFEKVKIRPDLPVDFLPRDSIGFTHIGNELFQIPFFIHHMLCSMLPVIINEKLSLRTAEILALRFCKKSQTVSTFVKIVLILLKQEFEFLHEKPAN